MVEDQQVCKPHGGAQVIQKVSRRIAELAEERQGPLVGRHLAFNENSTELEQDEARVSRELAERRSFHFSFPR